MIPGQAAMQNRRAWGRRWVCDASGFTLVDMLCLLAVIAVAFALFLPMRGQLAEDARMQLCIDNLGQIARAATFYSQDNAGFAPIEPIDPATGGESLPQMHTDAHRCTRMRRMSGDRFVYLCSSVFICGYPIPLPCAHQLDCRVLPGTIRGCAAR